MEKRERVLGLDILRTIAIFGVFITHFMSYRKALEIDVLSTKWTIYMIIRFLAMTSVPLFLLLTGYLNNKKEISKKYYKGIIPILISYVVISALELLARIFYLGEVIPFGECVMKILNFTANDYAWYFEMYIGLFLLIPFLNILYDNLKSKNEKFILVGSLAFLTLIPQVVKSFIGYEVWLNITPDYWQIIYPITYFYIGKLIKEFKPNLSIVNRILFLLIAILIPTSFCYIFTKLKGDYAWYMFNGFEALTNALTASAIFLMFYDFNKKIPIAKNIFTEISLCSFEMYLFSSIIDKYCYSKFDFSFPVMIIIVAVSTYIISRIFILIRDLFLKCLIRKDN